MNEIIDKMALLFNYLEHQDDEVGAKMADEILTLLVALH